MSPDPLVLQITPISSPRNAPGLTPAAPTGAGLWPGMGLGSFRLYFGGGTEKPLPLMTLITRICTDPQTYHEARRVPVGPTHDVAISR
jgi:hypothetical protein